MAYSGESEPKQEVKKVELKPIEKLNLEFPKNMKLREGCNDCKEKGFTCATIGTQDVCLHPTEPKQEGEFLKLFDIFPCEKTGKKAFEINDEVAKL
jgi:hypothetical protein